MYLLISPTGDILDRSETAIVGFTEVSKAAYETTLIDGNHTFKYVDGNIKLIPYKPPEQDKELANRAANAAHAAIRTRLANECEPQLRRARNFIILQDAGEKATQTIDQKQLIELVRYQESVYVWQLGEPQPTKPEWMIEQ